MLEQQGRVLVTTSPKLAQFAHLMSHPEFSAFFDENFRTIEDARTAIMLLKMSQYVKQRLGKDSNGIKILAGLYNLISQPASRQAMAHEMKQFEQGDFMSPLKLTMSK